MSLGRLSGELCYSCSWQPREIPKLQTFKEEDHAGRYIENFVPYLVGGNTAIGNSILGHNFKQARPSQGESFCPKHEVEETMLELLEPSHSRRNYQTTVQRCFENLLLQKVTRSDPLANHEIPSVETDAGERPSCQKRKK